MRVVLGHEGIQELKRELVRRKKILMNILEVLNAELANVGAEIMRQKAPTSDVDGNIPGSVEIERRSEGYAVSYIGQDVAYIEFGTGYKGESNKHPEYAKVNWVYDVNNHGESGWFYYSKRDGSLKYSRGGMYPEKPVYETTQELRSRMKGIVERVLYEKLG